MNVIGKPWFRRRRVGVGWTPATWQGWLLTLLALVGVIGVLKGMGHSGARVPIVLLIFGVYAVIALATGGTRAGDDQPADDPETRNG